MDNVEQLGNIPLWAGRASLAALGGGLACIATVFFNANTQDDMPLLVACAWCLGVALLLGVVGLLAGLLCWRAGRGKKAVAVSLGTLLCVSAIVLALAYLFKAMDT